MAASIAILGTVGPLSTEEFIRLFIESEPRVYAYIRTLAPIREDADEILQDAAAVMWEKFGQFRPGTDFVHWAFQIANYTVHAHYRRRKRDVLRFSEPLFAEIARDAEAMDDDVDDLRQALAACLAKLAQRDRDLLDLRYRAEATTKSVAQQLRRPASTIYNALQRIRKILYECIQRTLTAQAR